jgi:hypothetical protein
MIDECHGFTLFGSFSPQLITDLGEHDLALWDASLVLYL